MLASFKLSCSFDNVVASLVFGAIHESIKNGMSKIPRMAYT